MVEKPVFTSHMSPSDELMWTIERDPVLRSTVTAVALLDQVPDRVAVRAAVERAIAAIPRLRQRVAVPPVGPPQWVDVADVDLRYHLRWLAVPHDRSSETLLDLAAGIAMTGFDEARPLWEFVIVEGLNRGQAALIQKFHHSLTDGVGAMRLAGELFDLERQPAWRPAAITPALDAPGDAVSVVRRGLGDSGGRVLRLGAAAVPTAANLARELLLVPSNVVGETLALARSTARLLAPVSEPLSPIWRGRSSNRRFDAFDADLGHLRVAAGIHSLNDAFLSAVAAGLHRYHERHGQNVDELRMTMPVSIRADQDALGGNRFVPVRFAVPVAIADPAERIRVLAELSAQARAEPAMAFTDGLAAALNRLPKRVVTAIFGGMLKNVDFVTTNIPGFPTVVYIGGAAVLRQYVFGPPTGAAVNVALFSHAGTCCVGVTSDLKAVPDPDALTACLIEGFEDVVSAAPSRSRRAS